MLFSTVVMPVEAGGCDFICKLKKFKKKMKKSMKKVKKAMKPIKTPSINNPYGKDKSGLSNKINKTISKPTKGVGNSKKRGNRKKK